MPVECLAGNPQFLAQLTDAGLAHLKGLSYLGQLDLRDTKVTDAGLVRLKGLNKLHRLLLNDTQVKMS
jgi:hypothetical protein